MAAGEILEAQRDNGTHGEIIALQHIFAEEASGESRGQMRHRGGADVSLGLRALERVFADTL